MPTRETPFLKETEALLESAEKLRQKLEGELKAAFAHAQEAAAANEKLQTALDQNDKEKTRESADALEKGGIGIFKALDDLERKE